MAEKTKIRRFPERRLTLEEAAADPDNIVMTPAQSGLRFPFVIYGGGRAIGEAFGELAAMRENYRLTPAAVDGKMESN